MRRRAFLAEWVARMKPQKPDMVHALTRLGVVGVVGALALRGEATGKTLAEEEVDPGAAGGSLPSVSDGELRKNCQKENSMIHMPLRKVSKWENQKRESSKNKDRKSAATHPQCSDSSPSLTSSFFLQAHMQTCFFNTQSDQKWCTLTLNLFHLFSQASAFHKHSKASF